jgi:glycosyltransferase involved in cell wall biosynthesis
MGVTNDNHPLVSIIVPARNEEAGLAACLGSLVGQTGIQFQIIVVDDDSADGTAEIARSFSGNRTQHVLNASPDEGVRGSTTHVTAASGHIGADALVRPDFSTNRVGEALQARPSVTVIPAPPLPENWTGKNNAMSAGAKIAKGKWLLFTDADTIHKPGSLARAVAEAEQHGAALLSYSPEQEARTFWEQAVMPVIFAELAATYPPKKVNDPASPIAAANGQYLLIAREAYDAVGGHTKIASDLLEDVAMARLVKRSGRKIFFRNAPDAVRTRMYRSFAQLREGWTKNLALLFPRPAWLAIGRLAEFVWALAILNMVRGIVLWNPPVGLPEHLDHSIRLWEIAVLLSVWVYWLRYYILRMRKAHFSWRATAVSLFGLPVFAYLLLRSKQTQSGSRVLWKGREYRSYEPKPQNLPVRSDIWIGR